MASFEITWATLFPDWVLKALGTSSKAEGTTLVPVKKKISRQGLLQHFFEGCKEYITNPSDRDKKEEEKEILTQMGKNTYGTRYWPALEPTWYGRIACNIIYEAKAHSYNANTLPLNTRFHTAAQELVDRLPQADLEKYKEDIAKIIDKIPSGLQNNSFLRNFEVDKILKQRQENFPSQLAILVAIACVWTEWCTDLADSLGRLLLPPLKSPTDIAYEDSFSADEMLPKAVSEFEANELSKCIQTCKEIIRHANVPDEICMHAYLYIGRCLEMDPTAVGIGALDATYYYKVAKQMGCTDPHIKVVNQGAAMRYHPTVSAVDNMRMVFNTSEHHLCTRILLQTIPTQEELGTEHFFFAGSEKELKSAVDPMQEQCFYLFDDNPQKNFNDFLIILESIKKIPVPSSGKQTKIYLRAKEEQYVALIDTATRMSGLKNLQLFLLDDDKGAAQDLLSKHPLFWSLRDFPFQKSTTGTKTIHYTVIAATANDLTDWLIREAYWLGCFRSDKIKVCIHVISPQAEEIENRLLYNCPDIYSNSVCLNDISEIEVKRTKAEPPVNLFSSDFWKRIDTINSDYYVVNIGTDAENLSFAVKLRERTIRKVVYKNNGGASRSFRGLPVIAFYCQDPDIAILSENLNVHSLEQKLAWYNNYTIIPFGMLTDRYTYGNIEGDFFGRMGQCTHLQYCSTPIPQKADEERIRKDLESYFNRTYNQDSSLAVARSMPYRLFQIDASGKHIIPEDWQITDRYAYAEKNLLKMVELFEKYLDEETKRALCAYEHARWVRWAIARGWTPASPEQVLSYMRAGNPKHQLFIAKMHGCITSEEGLEQLAEKMEDRFSKIGGIPSLRDIKRYMDITDSGNYVPKDFISLDKKNIEATAAILRTEWLREDEHL